MLPAAAVLLLGPLVGLAWWLLAPTGAVVVAQGYLVPVGTATTESPSDVFAASQDAVFTALVGGAGALFGLAVGLRPGHGRSGLVRWVTVVVAGLGASVAAWGTGLLLGPASVAAQQAAGAQPLVSPLRLSSPAPLLVWSATTCAVAFAVTLVVMLLEPPDGGTSDAADS